MAGLSFDEIKSAKKNLRKAPPPKVPLCSTASQNDDFSSDTGSASVTAFRNKFEQKQSPSSKEQVGPPSLQGGDEIFEQKSVKKPPRLRKPTDVIESREGLRTLDNSNALLKGEPSRKELPPFVRIGAAPHKKHKPANLKFILDKYKDKIVLSNGANYTPGTTSQEDEDIYDDVESTLRVDQDSHPEETYECI